MDSSVFFWIRRTSQYNDDRQTIAAIDEGSASTCVAIGVH